MAVIGLTGVSEGPTGDDMSNSADAGTSITRFYQVPDCQSVLSLGLRARTS